MLGEVDRPGLRHPIPGDIEWIDEVVDEWPCTLRWDVKGLTPSVPSLMSRLWEGVATQRVVLGSDGAATGLLQLVDLSLVHGTGRFEALTRSPHEAAPSMQAFVEQVFDDLPLRVTHVFAIADAMDIAILLPEAREVGRLRDRHLRGRGTYEDLAIHELRRSFSVM